MTAKIFSAGETCISADLLYRGPDANEWNRVQMQMTKNDLYSASFILDRVGRWEYTIEAWYDSYATWLNSFKRWLENKEDSKVDLVEGIYILKKISAVASESDRTVIDNAIRSLSLSDPTKYYTASDRNLLNIVRKYYINGKDSNFY